MNKEKSLANLAFANYFNRYFGLMSKEMGYNLKLFREDLGISYTALNDLKKGASTIL